MNLHEIGLLTTYLLFGVAALAALVLAARGIGSLIPPAPTSAQFRSIVRGASL